MWVFLEHCAIRVTLSKMVGWRRKSPMTIYHLHDLLCCVILLIQEKKKAKSGPTPSTSTLCDKSVWYRHVKRTAELSMLFVSSVFNEISLTIWNDCYASDCFLLWFKCEFYVNILYHYLKHCHLKKPTSV